MPEVGIPTQLQHLTGGKQHVTVAGDTVGAIVGELGKNYPGIEAYLVEQGDLMPGLAVIIDGHQSSLGLLQRIGDAAEVHFLPAVGGG